MSSNPLKKRLFRRIFIIYALIMAAAVVFIELNITDMVRENYIRELRRDLAVQARLIAKTVPVQSASSLDAVCRQIKQDTGARVTVIAADGAVAGDSDHDSKTMDNHAHRQEIQQASL